MQEDLMLDSIYALYLYPTLPPHAQVADPSKHWTGKNLHAIFTHTPPTSTNTYTDTSEMLPKPVRLNLVHLCTATSTLPVLAYTRDSQASLSRATAANLELESVASRAVG